MPLLVVTADDYALTEAESRSILRAHHDGVVTEVSAFAGGVPFGELRDVPTLGVGVHLSLTGELRPMLPQREIPTLLDKRGRFAASWRRLLLRLVAGRIDAAELALEWSAQIERVKQVVPHLSHLDSHEHVHLWPVLGGVMIALAQRFGIRAVRVPRTRLRRLSGLGVRRLGAQFARRARAAGLWFPDAFAGFDEHGRLDRARLLRTVDALAGSSAEIAIHPGHFAHELVALCSPEVQGAIARAGFTLGRFDQGPTTENRPLLSV